MNSEKIIIMWGKKKRRNNIMSCSTWNMMSAISLIVILQANLARSLRCVQCSTQYNSSCEHSPPPPTECPGTQTYCLRATTYLLKEPRSIFDKSPSSREQHHRSQQKRSLGGGFGGGGRSDYADEDSPNPSRTKLLFLVRTCVKDYKGDGCREGSSTSTDESPTAPGGQRVEFCSYHCRTHGCNGGQNTMQHQRIQMVVLVLLYAHFWLKQLW